MWDWMGWDGSPGGVRYKALLTMLIIIIMLSTMFSCVLSDEKNAEKWESVHWGAVTVCCLPLGEQPNPGHA